MAYVGAFCFGFVVGWITYRTLRRSKTTGLSDISTVIGAVGGAAILSLFPTKGDTFPVYSIGLFIGFFLYLVVGIIGESRQGKTKQEVAKRVNKFLGGDED